MFGMVRSLGSTLCMGGTETANWPMPGTDATCELADGYVGLGFWGHSLVSSEIRIAIFDTSMYDIVQTT